LVKQKAVEVWGAIQQLFQTVMTAIVGFFTTAFSAITTFFENLPKMIWDFLGMATLKIIEWTAFILAYLIFAIPQWIEAIISFVSTLPSKVGAWLTETYNGITTWGTNTGNYFATTVPVWIANITTWFAALPGKISSALSGLGKTLVSSFGDAWNNLLGTLAEWKNNIWEWGSNIAKAFVEGFKNAIAGIANAFKEGVENARKSIEGHSPPVAGPLKDIDKWGYNIGNAWVAGLKSAISDFQMPAIGGSTYNQNINVNAPINNNLDAYSLASILGQQLAFSGKYD
jgi:phage-related protein